ncbi:MAG: hypothetical protein R2764_15865 [Bacteroidales bacterium]
MSKKIYLLFIIVAIIVSCNNSQNNQPAETSDQEVVEESVILTINDFDASAVDYVGKEVQIAGLVNHACKHGGKECSSLILKQKLQSKLRPVNKFQVLMQS